MEAPVHSFIMDLSCVNVAYVLCIQHIEPPQDVCGQSAEIYSVKTSFILVKICCCYCDKLLLVIFNLDSFHCRCYQKECNAL